MHSPTPETTRSTILTDRFWSKVEVGVCWTWTAAINSTGYGQWGVNGRSKSVHRLAWEALVGPIPVGLTIDHLCRNKRCVNPDHMETVTVAVNNARKPAANKTHCIRGHQLSGDNLRINGLGRRSCRTCARAAAAAQRERRRAEAA